LKVNLASYKHAQLYKTKPAVGLSTVKVHSIQHALCADKLSPTFDESSNEGANHSAADAVALG